MAVVTKRLALALNLTILLLVPAVWAQEQPNIVFMIVDNLGWGEIGAYGGGILRGAETPRLDEFAPEGMRLLNFNVSRSIRCKATSASATVRGRHAKRVRQIARKSRITNEPTRWRR